MARAAKRAGLFVAALVAIAATARAQAPTYRALVAAESDDQVALIAFTPCAAGQASRCGATVERTYLVGLYPADIEGPHGVVIAPDEKSFYVTIAHGRPNGMLMKYDLASGRLIDRVDLGMFPATVDISADGSFLYAINFNFEDPEVQPSTLSIVDGNEMVEVARPTTCRMPHGSRLNPAGTKHYSACMMNDMLVEVDARTLGVSRMFSLAPGAEGAADPAKVIAMNAGKGGHDMASMATMSHGEQTTSISNKCSPTWAQPSADGAKVFVACNASAEIVEVDVAAWRIARRWKTPAAPYNLAVTPDGKLLLATQKGPGTITAWRVADASLAGEVKGTRRLASGIAITGDSRYAFATLEGVRGDPGTVDVIDLATMAKVATVDVGKQAGGIAIFRDIDKGAVPRQ